MDTVFPDRCPGNGAKRDKHFRKNHRINRNEVGMMLSGFTIIRNGVKFDFPFLESIRSALPICDEFVINVGVSEDDTKVQIQNLIASLDPKEARKVKIFDSVWTLDDPEKRKGGHILADQTNLALDRCTGDWCLYIQADEVLHEQDLPLIRKQLEEVSKLEVIPDGLVFQYVHFYGNYNVIQTSRTSYRREIRVIKN